MKTRFLTMTVFLAFAGAPLLFAQRTFTIVSFNTLHYGWGGLAARVGKTGAITNLWQNGMLTPAAMALQEIMPQAGNAQVIGGLLPGLVDIVLSANSYGTGNYQERYLILLDPGRLQRIRSLEFQNLAVQNNGTFSRPPMLVEVRPQGGPRNVVIGDFHAIWGRRKAQRTAEAAAMCTVFLPAALLQLAGNENIALAGDWNLTEAEVANVTNVCIANVLPTGLTTLNRRGALSSSYDHAADFQGNALLMLNGAVVMPPNLPMWRRDVSDHLPIAATFQY